jgi:hypothetical protein
MKKFIIISFCLLLTGVTSFSQTTKTPVKPAPKQSVIIPVAAVSEISNAEWNELTKALEAENWDKSTLLSSLALQKLKIDNEKKQLASLRYFYLYSLAGKVQQNKTTFAEFEKISQAFIGKEFLMPSRQVLSDCTGKMNYICPVKNDSMSLRVTATDKVSPSISIIFFEYYQLNESFDLAVNHEKKVFLGGKLARIESSLKNNMRIIRLFFEEATAGIIK